MMKIDYLYMTLFIMAPVDDKRQIGNPTDQGRRDIFVK